MEGVGDDVLEFLLGVFSLFVGAVIAYFVFRPSRYVRLDPRSQSEVREARRSVSSSTATNNDSSEETDEGAGVDAADAADATNTTMPTRPEDEAIERDICAVCRDTPTNAVRTPCNHWYCAECILQVWSHSSRNEPCKCPICRRPITVLIPYFRQPDAPDAFANVRSYNRRFSGEPRSWWETIREAPVYISSFVADITRDPAALVRLLRGTRFMLAFLALIFYLLSPFDLIPETVFGLIGLMDDIVVSLVLLVVLSSIYRHIRFSSQS